MQQYTRDMVVDRLAGRKLDDLDFPDIEYLLKLGWRGYVMMNDRELLEHFIRDVLLVDSEGEAFQYITAGGDVLDVEPIADWAGAGIKIDNVVDDYQYL